MDTESNEYWSPLVPELTVSDLEASLSFYQTLGFTVRFCRPQPRFAYLELGKSQIMLEEQHDEAWITARLEKPYGRGINMQIKVTDASEMAEQAADKGVSLFAELSESWYKISAHVEKGQLEFLLQDPDGYLLRFSQALGSRTIKR